MAHARMCGAIESAVDGLSQPAALSPRQQLLCNAISQRLGAPDAPASVGRGRPTFWDPTRLLMASVAMVWDSHRALVDSFAVARGLWPDEASGMTYQGVVKALGRHKQALFDQAGDRLRQQMLHVHQAQMRLFGFFVLAVDGSRFALPRSVSNVEAMGTAARDNASPQMMVTQLWQVGLGVPWLWRSGPGGGDERGDLVAMIDQTPADSLILADAGFTSYATLKAVIDSGRHMVLRACGSLSLLQNLEGVDKVERQGKLVYLWPAYAQKAGQMPVVLRLHQVCGPTRDRKGRSLPPVWVVTSVLDHRRLSGKQLGMLFKMRWGVEVCYRTLKQTMDRHRLRSRSSAGVALEIQSLLLGLLVLGELTVSRVLAAGKAATDWSPAQALRIVRDSLPAPLRAWSIANLGQAVKDTYQRKSKKVREPFPRKKEHEGPKGEPQVRDATEVECARYAALVTAG